MDLSQNYLLIFLEELYLLKIVFNYLINKGFEFTKIEKFIQELCWRDYWQLIWCKKKHLINNDLKNKQVDVENQYLSIGILNATTKICKR